MYQHLDSLLQQWTNFPSGINKVRLNILSPQNLRGTALVQIATSQHTSSLKHCTLQHVDCICMDICDWRADEHNLASFCCSCQAFWKLPLNNLDYHTNSVNTHLFVVPLSAGDLHTGRWWWDLCVCVCVWCVCLHVRVYVCVCVCNHINCTNKKQMATLSSKITNIYFRYTVYVYRYRCMQIILEIPCTCSILVVSFVFDRHLYSFKKGWRLCFELKANVSMLTFSQS